MARRRRGFTLIELAVVVALVGILSVIAIVGYRRMTRTSKVAEAQNMVLAIKQAEERYFQFRTGTYYSAGTGFCPSDGTTQKKFMWNTTCNTNKWIPIDVHADGPFQFGYRALANGDESELPTVTANGTNIGNLVTTRPWYVVEAQADLDGLGGLMTHVVTTSQGQQVFVVNAGE